MQLVLLTVLHKRCWGVSLEETWAASGDQKRKYTTSFNSRGLCQGWQVHCAKRNSNGLKALQAAKLQWKYCSIWTVLWVLKHEIQRWQILMLRSMDKKLHWEKHWIPRSSNTSSLIPRPLFAKKKMVWEWDYNSSSIYVTMGLPSALLMSRQLLKAIYSVITCCLYVANILHLQIVYCLNCSNIFKFKN